MMAERERSVNGVYRSVEQLLKGENCRHSGRTLHFFREKFEENRNPAGRHYARHRWSVPEYKTSRRRCTVAHVKQITKLGSHLLNHLICKLPRLRKCRCIGLSVECPGVSDRPCHIVENIRTRANNQVSDILSLAGGYADGPFLKRNK